MNFSKEMLDEIKLSDVTVSENIPNSFKSAININPQFEREIQEIYIRRLKNYGRTTLNTYHLKYMEMFNFLAQFYGDSNEELNDFANSLITSIDSYFEELDTNLNIRSQNDLDELKYILQISFILMEEVFEDKNIELAYESFFQIERRIKKYNLYKKSVHILNDNDFEILIHFPENGIHDDASTTVKLNELSFGDNEYEL